MKKICVLASLNMDYTVRVEKMPQAGETIFGKRLIKHFGGKGANQAVALKKLGQNIIVIGKLGNDEDGFLYRNYFKQLQIEDQNILCDASVASGAALIYIDEYGENSIVVASGANKTFSVEEIESKASQIQSSKILISQFEIPLEVTKRAFEIAKEAGVFTIFNPAPMKVIQEDMFAFIDLLIPNEVEMNQMVHKEHLSKEEMIQEARKLIMKGLKRILITLGSKGSLYVDEKEAFEIPSRTVEVVDTTAAGDAFVAGVASKLCEYDMYTTQSFKEAMEYATLVSSLTIQKSGAQSSLPMKTEVIQYQKET